MITAAWSSKCGSAILMGATAVFATPCGLKVFQKSKCWIKTSSTLNGSRFAELV